MRRNLGPGRPPNPRQQWSCAECRQIKLAESAVTYDYDAFGNLIHSTGTTFNEFLFAGEQFDSDLGLYYNRARYLNVSTGRFWTMDDFDGIDSDPRSLHKYVYGQNDGVNKTDPSGRDTLVDFNFAAALVIALAATIVFAAANVCRETIRTLGREGPCRIPDPENPDRQFYKGTTLWEADPYSALGLDIEEQMNRMNTAPMRNQYDFGPGFYMTESYSTAYTFAEVNGGTSVRPIKGGPAILGIKIKNEKWEELKSQGARDAEPISTMPGHYQAFVPLNLFQQFVLFARFLVIPVN